MAPIGRMFIRTGSEKDDKENSSENRVNDVVRNIVNKDISTMMNIKGESINIEVKGVKFGDVGHKKDVLLDEQMLNGRLNELVSTFARTVSKYNVMPKKVVIYNEESPECNDNCNMNGDSSESKASGGSDSNDGYSKQLNGKDSNGNNSGGNKEEAEKESSHLFNAFVPKWKLDDIYLKEESKNNILTALTMIKHKDKLFNEWKIKGNKNDGRAVCLNFWGSPGTGKSMTAEGVASYLNKKLLVVNYPELESKYVGETPKNIKKVFDKAKEENAVIVFDEADSFLGKRLENVTQSADYGVNITRSVMLIELENFDGVIIFTTNLLSNYDEAFKRRILANVEFEMPDAEGRKLIWNSHLPKEMPVEEGINKDVLAEKFDNITGADIKDIILMAATETLRNSRETVSMNDFEYAYSIIMKRYKEQKKAPEYKVVTERISEEQYLKETANGEKQI